MCGRLYRHVEVTLEVASQPGFRDSFQRWRLFSIVLMLELCHNGGAGRVGFLACIDKEKEL